MAAMAGVFHHAQAGMAAFTAGQTSSTPTSAAAANPMTAGASDTTSSGGDGGDGGDSSTISSNDFLSLLVTEMQNQDPTADTDPNEYINQLVQINSLEQLISINQNLSTVLGTTPAGSTGDVSSVAATGSIAPAESKVTPSSLTGAHTGNGTAAPGTITGSGSNNHGSHLGDPRHAQTAGTAAAIQQFANSQMARSVGADHAPGNLSVPQDHGAARRVAHALDGHAHANLPIEKQVPQR